MLNLVISSWVIGSTPSLFFCIKNGITDPLEPITLPYRTTLNRTSFDPLILLAAANNLSETSLVAPYKFIGAHALSVDSATTSFTPHSKAAWITFSAPSMFVRIHSVGLYSAVSTCLIAAAWMITSIPSQALFTRSLSRTSPIKNLS